MMRSARQGLTPIRKAPDNGRMALTNAGRGLSEEFEWDPNKAQSNCVRHGVRSEKATRVFEP